MLDKLRGLILKCIESPLRECLFIVALCAHIVAVVFSVILRLDVISFILASAIAIAWWYALLWNVDFSAAYFPKLDVSTPPIAFFSRVMIAIVFLIANIVTFLGEFGIITK
jgi:hypothetical protein